MSRINVVFVAVVVVCIGIALVPLIGRAQSKGPHDIHPTADIHPSVVMEGKVTVGAYTKIDAGTVLTGNVTIRGRVQVGNYTHIYDNVCIEGGRPARTGSTVNEEPDQAIIGNYCWINHGATMHGTRMADRSAVNLNSCCDYNTRLGEGAVLANGSATHTNQVIGANCFAEGVPAVVKKENITDEDRTSYFGLIPAEWARYEGERQEERARRR